MPTSSNAPPLTRPAGYPLWLRISFSGCVLIAVAVVIRRIVALASPSAGGPPQMAQLDQAFAGHAVLTLAHILPAALFVLLCPFVLGQRGNKPSWLMPAFFALGAWTGVTAYAMSRYAVGGWVERSAVLLFNTLFLVCLSQAWLVGRRHPISARPWLLRSIALLLGIATTRPVMGIFFATSRLTHLEPSQFFGLAFWIGFSINTIAMEFWLRRNSSLHRPEPESLPL